MIKYMTRDYGVINEQEFKRLREIDANLYELLYGKCDHPDGYYGVIGYGGLPGDENSVWIDRVPYYTTDFREMNNLLSKLTNNEEVYYERINNRWYVRIITLKDSLDRFCGAGEYVTEAFCQCIISYYETKL